MSGHGNIKKWNRRRAHFEAIITFKTQPTSSSTGMYSFSTQFATQSSSSEIKGKLNGCPLVSLMLVSDGSISTEDEAPLQTALTEEFCFLPSINLQSNDACFEAQWSE